MSSYYAFFDIKPHLDTCQLVLIPERAFRAFPLESVEAAHSVWLTHVEFRAIRHVTGEAGCALCQVVVIMEDSSTRVTAMLLYTVLMLYPTQCDTNIHCIEIATH